MAEASMTLYDMSKQMIANEPPMDHVLFSKKINEIAEEITKNSIDKTYWMLLCRERYDYTILITDMYSKKSVVNELIPTLKNRGQVIFIDKQPNGAWEIWIRDPQTKENFAYYLFNYSNAIIDCT